MRPHTPPPAYSPLPSPTPAYAPAAPMRRPRPGEAQTLLAARQQAEEDLFVACVAPGAGWCLGTAVLVWCLCPPCGR